MLSTNSTSSIQKRRQQHRRQQSLEVPILATPLPANPRRTQSTHQGHRRGLSLDQSLSALSSPAGFRPLLQQDQDQFIGPSPVRIQLDTTNTGHPPDQQHFVQETQQHRPAQPGFQAQDFQSHLQQQLNGRTSPSLVAPTPTHPNQQQALQELQHHLEWYKSNFGHSPSPNMQTTNFHTLNQPIATDMSMHPVEAQMQQQQSMVIVPQTPVSHGHSRTVPNTPQQYAQTWPSPPPTDVKHARSQSFQFDVAPMPMSFEGGHIMKNMSSPYSQVHGSFAQDSYTVSDEHGYASSSYSSSIVDAMSPGRQHNLGPMPTLFEEVTPPFGTQPAQSGIPEDALLLQATVGASDDFNSPNFIVGGGPLGMSPHAVMAANLPEDVNATIVDTGIAAEVVDRQISEMDPDTKLFYCLFEEDNGKKCNKWFKRKENARSHVQNHIGDRQFMCNDCGKTFVRQHDMKRHAAIHSDDRPHVCPCGSGFARHDALTRHRQRGMCEGALPGYEKAEEDKPKRGRPKKERPDQKTRTTKAKKARQMDRENEIAAQTNYASSNSAYSERSLPVTPPDTSDFDADAFINMANVDVPFNSNTSSWRDTPPTSPASASPTKVVEGCSSPIGYDNYDCGIMDSHPDVAAHELFSDAFSTSYGSPEGSSPFTSMDMPENATAAAASAWDEFMNDKPLSAAEDEHPGMADQLTWWIRQN